MKNNFPYLKRYKFILLAVVLIANSCKEEEKKAPPPPEVKVVKVIQKNTPIYKEFVGQMFGLKDIPIRARVEGFLDGIYFGEGMPVKKGALLYKIDP